MTDDRCCLWLLAAAAAAGCGGAQPLRLTPPPAAPVRVAVLPFADRRPAGGGGRRTAFSFEHDPSDAAEALHESVAAMLEATPGVRVERLPGAGAAAGPEAWRALARERDADLLLRGILLDAESRATQRADLSTEYRARVRFRVDWIDGHSGEVVASTDPAAGEAAEVEPPASLSVLDTEQTAGLRTRPSTAWDQVSLLRRLCDIARERALDRFRREHRLGDALGALEREGTWPRR